MTARAPFWSDNFDIDLLKVIPDADMMLGEAADVVLYTHSHTPHGGVNCPTVWHTAQAAMGKDYGQMTVSDLLQRFAPSS